MKLPASLLLLLAPALHAAVRLPAVFGDHAVLQRDRPLPVWGWADPGEEVVVSLGSQRASARADGAGKWLVRLAPQPASAEPLTLRVAGAETIESRDILLGDLWLCSGQSNMDWGLGGCDAPDDIASADFPRIRHFRVEYNFASAPAADVSGAWSVCTPQSAPGFSAVGFYFGRRVHAETGVPVGLLTNAVGGTNIELWMCQETLLGAPELDAYAAQMRESLEAYQKQLTEALPAIEQWTRQCRSAIAGSNPLPLPPEWPQFPFGERVARPRCVTLHNGHVAPLVPMALRGVLWYQGESNAGDNLYFEKKRAMVADWRRWFVHPDLPFYFVQLAAFEKPDDNPSGGGWGPIREQQRRCLTIPHTGMACAIDIGEADDIHPKNKFDVGERLALWALADEYGRRDVVTSGPLYQSIRVEGDRVRISFSSLGGGLVVGRKEGRAPAAEDRGARLQRFAVAGEDRQWHWAEAVIDGDTVLVRSPEVAAPVAVRYAFCSNPAGANLYNRAGLPAPPFRSDDW